MKGVILSLVFLVAALAVMLTFDVQLDVCMSYCSMGTIIVSLSLNNIATLIELNDAKLNQKTEKSIKAKQRLDACNEQNKKQQKILADTVLVFGIIFALTCVPRHTASAQEQKNILSLIGFAWPIIVFLFLFSVSKAATLEEQ